MFGNAMFTIVASTNATAAPSYAIASTVRGAGPRRPATAAASSSCGSIGERPLETAAVDIPVPTSLLDPQQR